MVNKKSKDVGVTIQSTLDEIETVEKLAEKAADQMQFSEDEKDSLAIAVTEAVNNAIIHGNKQDRNKKVHINIAFEGKKITVKVKDQGKGFNPKNLRDPIAPENLLKESGRGIFILKALMDEVHFNFNKDGTEIIMIKAKK